MRVAAVLVGVAALAAGGGLWWWSGRSPTSVEPTGTPATAPSVATPPSGNGSRTPAPPAASVAPVVGVTGVTLGPDDQPVAGVKVELRRELSPWPDQVTELCESALTGEDGRFLFQTAAASGLILVAVKEGLATAEAPVAELSRDNTMRLYHGFAVHGIVEGAHGRCVADCEVILEPTAFSNQRALSTRTDANGAFTFKDVRAASGRLVARHAESQPTFVPIAAGSTEVHRLRFSRKLPLSLQGSVVAAGVEPKPVAGALVRAFPSSWNRGLFLPVITKTDAAGRFVLGGLGPGNLHVEVRHPDHSTKGRVVAVSGGNPELMFELVGRTPVAGRLTGQLVPAGTRLALTQAGEPTVYATTDAEGRFAFPGRQSAGLAELTLTAGGYCFEETAARSLSVELEENGETQLDLRVVAPGVVRGVVRDPDAAPLAGVRVLWPRRNEGPARAEVLAVTDTHGRYEICGLPQALVGPGPFALLSLMFQADGYASGELRFSGAAPGQIVELDGIVLQRPGTIRGRVTRNGHGIAGAVVFAGQGRKNLPDVSDANGDFALRDLAPGQYRVRVRYATMPIVVDDQQIEIVPGVDFGPIEVTLPPGRTISGQVVAPDDSAIANAVIVVRGVRGGTFYSEADGEFALEVPRQEVSLQVFASDQFDISRSVRVPLDTDRVRIEMPLVPWGTVLGRVLGPGRKPVSGGILRVTSLDGSSGDPGFDAQREIRASWLDMNAGELRLPRFPAGRSSMTLQCEGFAPHVRDLDVPARGEINLGTIVLETGAKVSGVITNDQGKPVPGARVHLGDELDFALPRARIGVPADVEGRFVVRGVSPHAGTLVVAADGYATLTRPLVVPADLLRTDPLPLTLERGTTIRVRVLGGERDDRELTLVMLKKAGRFVDYGLTDQNGVVEFEHKSLGRYEVDALGEAETTQPVMVEAGSQEVEVTVRTRPLGVPQ